jgi:uncharacterized membrane protein
MMVFFFLLLIAVVAYAAGWRPQFAQWLQPGRPQAGSADSVQEILRERYARGEISREQYQEMRDELSR